MTLSDVEFLVELHARTMRAAVLATWGVWDDGWQRQRLIDALAPERIKVVCFGEQPIGALEVERRDTQIVLVNVQILPAFQGRGVGSHLVHRLIDEATELGLPLRLQVLVANTRAFELYQRLGLVETGRTDTHTSMEYQPSG